MWHTITFKAIKLEANDLSDNLKRDIWLWSRDPWPFAAIGKRLLAFTLL